MAWSKVPISLLSIRSCGVQWCLTGIQILLPMVEVISIRNYNQYNCYLFPLHLWQVLLFYRPIWTLLVNPSGWQTLAWILQPYTFEMYMSLQANWVITTTNIYNYIYSIVKIIKCNTATCALYINEIL